VLRRRHKLAFREEYGRRGLGGIAFVLRVGLDEARRIASGAYEIQLATLRTHLPALGRPRLDLEEMRRDVLTDYPGAVLWGRAVQRRSRLSPQGSSPKYGAAYDAAQKQMTHTAASSSVTERFRRAAQSSPIAPAKREAEADAIVYTYD